MTFVGLVGLVVLLGLSVFQLLLIAGKPLGEFAWGGQHSVLGKKFRIASVFSIALYALFAVFLLSKTGVVHIVTNTSLLDTGMWICTGYFTLGILANAISRSKKEQRLMTPVAALLAAVFATALLS